MSEEKQSLIALFQEIVSELGSKPFLVLKFAYEEYRATADIMTFIEAISQVFYDLPANSLTINEDKRRDMIQRICNYI